MGVYYVGLASISIDICPLCVNIWTWNVSEILVGLSDSFFFCLGCKSGEKEIQKSRQSKATPRSCVSTGRLKGVMKQQDKSALMKG